MFWTRVFYEIPRLQIFYFCLLASHSLDGVFQSGKMWISTKPPLLDDFFHGLCPNKLLQNLSSSRFISYFLLLSGNFIVLCLSFRPGIWVHFCEEHGACPDSFPSWMWMCSYFKPFAGKDSSPLSCLWSLSKINYILCAYFFFQHFYFQYWGLNTGLCTCWVSTLLLEPHPQSLCF
jgi:hypothetical protein